MLKITKDLIEGEKERIQQAMDKQIKDQATNIDKIIILLIDEIQKAEKTKNTTYEEDLAYTFLNIIMTEQHETKK